LGGWTQITGTFGVDPGTGDSQKDATDGDLTVTLMCGEYNFTGAAAAGMYFLFDDFQFSIV
jgi:hypothetical protein